MKLSKELVLQAVTAAFEFNAENKHAVASVSYDAYNLKLGLNVFTETKWAYYKVFNSTHLDGEIYAESHEQNVADFLDALESHSSAL